MSGLSRPLFGAAMALTLATPLIGNAQTQIDPAQPSTAATAAGAQSSAPAPMPAAATPTPSTSSALPAICTDRPTKSNNPCTVDAGHFQYEADVVNSSFMRLDGVTTDTYIVANPTLKYGLTSNLDIEANISPAEVVRTHDNAGDGNTLVGVSDLVLRLKYAFLNVHGGDLQAAIEPYVKAPTARPGIGNGVVEGGAQVPVTYKVNSILSVTTMPEVDFYKDSNGGGRHVNTAQLINFGVSLPKNVTVYGELWGDWNFDPAGTIRQYSADAAISYGVNNYLQLDGGLNFGLNRYTPGVQAYVGVSQKF